MARCSFWCAVVMSMAVAVSPKNIEQEKEYKIRKEPSGEERFLHPSPGFFQQRFVPSIEPSVIAEERPVARKRQKPPRRLQKNMPASLRHRSYTPDEYSSDLATSGFLQDTQNRQKTGSSDIKKTKTTSHPSKNKTSTTTVPPPEVTIPAMPLLPGISINNPSHVFFNINIVVNNGKMEEPVTEHYERNCSKLRSILNPQLCPPPKQVEFSPAEIILANLKPDQGVHQSDQSEWPAYSFPSKYPKIPGYNYPLNYSYNCRLGDVLCVYPDFENQRKLKPSKKNKEKTENP